MKYIKTFSEIRMNDVPVVGGKNASLGEMYSQLSSEGIRVPNGFAITSEAYRYFIKANGLTEQIEQTLASMNISELSSLRKTGKSIRGWIMHGNMPQDLNDEIAAAYAGLAKEYGSDPDVAVRSSATAEDLPTASFAGQQETYLNISGINNLLYCCKRVFASLFTDRAISYRVDKKFSHNDVALSIGVQKMVRADQGASGVMFTLDTESGFRDVILITSAYGLGENIVQGTVNPDEFYVFKPMTGKGLRPILKRQLGEKAVKLIYASDTATGLSTRNVSVDEEDRNRFSLDDNEVLELAHYGMVIEKHYSKQAGHDMPMDIEWAKDGKTGDLYILQARPETVQSQSTSNITETFQLKKRGKVLVTGRSVGQKVAVGKARVINDTVQMGKLQDGEILVTEITDPDWEPVMKKAGAIITNRGGRTCHAAIVARELGIPAIVGCGHATQVIQTGSEITVSCSEGDIGFVYEGSLPFSVHQVESRQVKNTRTKIMLNLGNPEKALEYASLPVDGVGLARLEFIINQSIRVHPQALLRYESLDAETRVEIDEITAGYPDKRSFYVMRLAEGIGTIAAAFYPKPVIVRLSDFKSNEYAALLGGDQFEPIEENPMIGFRGASRYPSAQFSECFEMECEALKFVRERMGLDNVSVMVPFVRTVDEGREVLELMRRKGLGRGEHKLKIYLMCEIPANALLADKFLDHFDGFSIGSNDLTQLTLGVDRDSSLVKSFDERNPAVTKLMEMAISACKERKKYIGICGQAPSDYPEITRWLVEQGIDSISLNPDSVISMIKVVTEAEDQL